MLKKINEFIEKIEKWATIYWWVPNILMFSLLGILFWFMVTR